MGIFWNRVKVSLLLSIVITFSSPLWALEIPATTEWYQRTEITPLRSGVVESVFVDVGMRVKRGKRLLQLEVDVEKSQLELTKKRVKQAELLYSEGQREYERVEDLYERTLISDHDRAMGEAAWSGMAEKLQSAKTALIKANREIRYRRIKAPIDAIIIARTVEVGFIANHLIPQSPLLTIASADFMAVDGFIEQSQLDRVKNGGTVQIKLLGKMVKGRVESIAMEPNVGSDGQYRLRLLIPYAKHLRAGMSATILLD